MGKTLIFTNNELPTKVNSESLTQEIKQNVDPASAARFQDSATFQDGTVRDARIVIYTPNDLLTKADFQTTISNHSPQHSDAEVVELSTETPSLILTFSDRDSGTKRIRSKSYKTASVFRFRGSVKFPIQSISMVVSQQSTQGTSSARIYDITNNKIIAQVNINGKSQQELNFGSLNNVSLNPAIWELQLKNTSNKYIYIASLIME